MSEYKPVSREELDQLAGEELPERAAMSRGLGFAGRRRSTEHLLLGALRFGRGHAVAALMQLGVELPAARANAQVTLVNGSPDGGTGGPTGDLDPGPSVFGQSLRDAARRGDGYIGIEHLLLAALGDDESGTHRTLEALRVDVPALIARL